MKIYRHEVPVDDQWHDIPLCGTPLHVACRDPRYVEFWAESREDNPTRSFRVFGTGHVVEDHVTYQGTAIAPGGYLVWHLFTKAVPQ